MYTDAKEPTASLPSDAFLWAAVGAMAAAALLQLSERRHAGLFIGQWAAPFLLFGIYDKLVKGAGAERRIPKPPRTSIP